MNLLIDLAYIREEIPASANLKESKAVVPYIVAAQEFDLRPFLSDQFFKDILANPGNYTALLTRTDYTHGGELYTNPGLKACLARYAYARMKLDSNAHDTAFGTVVKNNPYSEPVTDKTILRQVNEYREQAAAYANQIKEYLCRNLSTYPLYNNGTKEHGVRRASKIYGTK